MLDWMNDFGIVVFRIFRCIRNVPRFHLLRLGCLEHRHNLLRLRKIRIQPGFFQLPRQLHGLPVVVGADHRIWDRGDDGEGEKLCVGGGVCAGVVKPCSGHDGFVFPAEAVPRVRGVGKMFFIRLKKMGCRDDAPLTSWKFQPLLTGP